MALPEKDKNIPDKKIRKKSLSGQIANILEELVSALIMALLVITFVVQPFIIPTGSMADTLKGAHFRFRCRQCGYRYDHNFEPTRYKFPENTVPPYRVQPPVSRCPSCGYYNLSSQKAKVSKGEKILALKFLYQFCEPKRWDVIVFKNPLKPSQNYIKRLVGKPGETVEIIDGDIYIDDKIARKPAKTQDELWMPVYDNDYQPLSPREVRFNSRPWRQPFRNDKYSNWIIDKDDKTVFHLDSPVGQNHWLIYDTSIGNDFSATYAYDDVHTYGYMPNCSDLMIRFYIDFAGSDSSGLVGAALSKYMSEYKAWVESTGKMVISKLLGSEEIILNEKHINAPATKKLYLVKFANVDHQLIFEFGDEKLTYDMGRSVGDAGEIESEIEPEVKIFGSGKLTIDSLAVFRDIHYLSKSLERRSQKGFAVQGNSLTLAKDEFFVLGDNSPASLDGRWWDRPGKGNNGRIYRAGIVPRDYLMGKALVVFWPSGFKPFDKFPFSIIPYISQMRLIYGGSNSNN